MLRQYQEAYRESRAGIESQAGEQSQQLEGEATRQREDIERQATEARRKALEVITGLEAQRTGIVGELESAEALEQRRRQIEVYEPVQLRTKARIEDVEEQATEYISSAQEVVKDIDKQEAEALANIDKALADAKLSLSKTKDDAIREVSEHYTAESIKFEAENIELADGQWVNKTEWETYFKDMPFETATHLKGIATTEGLEAMNREVEKLSKVVTTTEPVYTYEEVPPENSVKLMSGEYVDKDIFDTLPMTDQNTLRIQGIDAYNQMIEERVKSISIPTPIYTKTEIIEPPEQIVVEEKVVEVVEFSTPAGTQQMLKEDWDALSEMKQVEMGMGRPPTLAEWQAYRIDRDLVKPMVVMNYDVDSYFRSQPFSTLLGEITRLVPGTQKYEVINNVMGDAEMEWKREYPKLYATGIVATSLGMWFPVAKTLYPDITVKDTTVGEWAITAGSVALLTAPIWIPKVASVVTRPRITQAKLTPQVIKAEVQRTYLAADQAGVANKAMTVSIQKLSKIEPSSIKYPKVSSEAQVAIQKSIKADLKFVERYSALDKVVANDLRLYERASGMTGLRDATIRLVKARQAYEKVLKKAGTETALITDAKVRLNLETTRTAFMDALANFQQVTQVRASIWRTPSPDVLETTYTIKPKPVNPDVQKLFDEINDYLLAHPKIAPESRGGVAVAIKPKIVKPAPELQRVPKVKVKEGEVAPFEAPEVKIAEIVTAPPKPTPTPTPVPPAVKPSVFPGITAKPREKVEYVPRTVADTERLGAMTPEQRQRLTEGEETAIVDAVSPYVIGLTPSTQAQITSITLDAVEYINQLHPLNLTHIQIQQRTQAFIQAKLNAITEPAVQTQIKTLTSIMTDTAIQTSTATTVGLKTTPVTRIPPVGVPLPTAKPAEKGVEHRPVDGTAVWKMGEPRGGAMYYAVPPPYTERYAIRGRPLGLTKPDVTGEGSAYATFEIVGGAGKITQDADIDIGVTVVHLRKEQGIDFSRDPKDVYKGKGVKAVSLPTTQALSQTEAVVDTPLITVSPQPVGEFVSGYYRKPRGEKNWWDSDFYEPESSKAKHKEPEFDISKGGGRFQIARLKKSGKVLIHRLLPPDLGGELQ